MTGHFQVSLPLAKGKQYYVSERDNDPGFGGDFYLFLEPLEGTDGSRFFYVRFLKNGMADISGEGYIIAPSDLGRRRREACREYEQGNIRYFILNDDGMVAEKREHVSQADWRRHMESKGDV